MNKMLNDELTNRPRVLMGMDDPEPSMFISDISKLFSRQVALCFPDDISSQGSRMIFHILCLNDGLTQVELAKKAGLSAPSVSASLTKMENEGLIERRPDPKDRRKVYVFITAAGRERDEMIRRRCREVESIMLRGVSSEEREQLIAMLRRLLGNLLEEGDL